MFGTEYGFIYIAFNFIIMILGIISHFAKKKIKGQTLADFTNYFNTHFKDTVITVIAGIVLFGSLAATGGLGWIASFTAGYTSDSLFNKNAIDDKD